MEKYTLNDLITVCHTIALAKGFWDEKDCPKCLGRGYIAPNIQQSRDGFEEGFGCDRCNNTGRVLFRNDGEAIALMHSELSEALEALRKENRENLAEELADCVIRILDYCGGNNIDLEKVLIEKIAKNMDRPYKHGKEF